MKADLQFVYDDLHEMETYYRTEADEDHGNIYWYFKDPFWNRKFFPITLSYARAKNNYYKIVRFNFEQLTFLKYLDQLRIICAASNFSDYFDQCFTV
ncbi:unnamed protein product [Gongylonema pulchrum]|uniref:Uncharacterized protein n=1 Tax=Gongylonema pulchrum TaxID=637853 RepID=A0A183DBP5_9BILA|nr:unnamed protein product [Gongylonema pulchrum]